MAFIAPSFLMVTAVAAVYAHYSGLAIVTSLFYGIAPAVMAIITIAAYKLVRLTDGKDRRAWAISAVVFIVTATTGQEPIYLIVGAGLLLILLDARPAWRLPRRKPPATPTTPTETRRSLAMLPLTAPALGVLASGGVLVSLGLFFLKTGALVFGSGLAIVPLLRDGVVAQHHWLTQAQFLDAVAMGLITPGPVVITAAFIGYLVAGPAGRSSPPSPSSPRSTSAWSFPAAGSSATAPTPRSRRSSPAPPRQQAAPCAERWSS